MNYEPLACNVDRRPQLCLSLSLLRQGYVTPAQTGRSNSLPAAALVIALKITGTRSFVCPIRATFNGEVASVGNYSFGQPGPQLVWSSLIPVGIRL